MTDAGRAWSCRFRVAAGRWSARRRLSATAIVLLIGAVTGTIVLPLRPFLVWNASASAPMGLYVVLPHARPHVGDMVIAKVPEHARLLAAHRRYLPAGVPLVKRVAAVDRDRVCAHGPEISINGRRIAGRRAVDGAGRPMPWWNGCRTLGDGDVFLLTDDPVSFDGRYFGPTKVSDVVGRALLLWAAR